MRPTLLAAASTLAAASGAAASDLVAPTDLAVDSTLSILGVAKTLAAGVLSYYAGNESAFADLSAPYYWWEAGAMLGALADYSHYTNDTTYDGLVATGLLVNAGPTRDYMVPAHRLDEGNDDQAFWAFSALSAAEHGLPVPPAAAAAAAAAGVFSADADADAEPPSWLDLSVNVWNSMVVRWNTSLCNGGFTWQIFADNYNGLDYKNTASNGGFFQISARLARLTGNQTYVDWAARVWDWTVAVGLIDTDYNVFDGTDSADNCSAINPLSFSYQNGIYLYGAAVLANHTGDPVWAQRAVGLLGAAAEFFDPPGHNTTNVMWEHACEGVGTCTKDMKTFKGFLSRFLAASATMLPALLAPNVTAYLQASARAAAAACSGGPPPANLTATAAALGNTTCGQKWYVGGFDGSVGLGQEMSALETVQGLLALNASRPDNIVPAATTTAAPSPSPSASQNAAPWSASSDARAGTLLGLACAVFVWGLA